MYDSKRSVIVVGGGPVGTLNAIFLGRRGFKVDLYESRSDIRRQENASGRSINLALSVRGLSALKHAGIDKEIIAIGTPMPSRYIHAQNGQNYTIPYGKKEQFLLSTDRLELNRKLLTLAEKSENVEIHFKHKLVKCDTKIPSATFQTMDGELHTENPDVILGCDGAYSAVRSQMLKGRMDYSQQYIEHGYKELTILPSSDGDYSLPPNHLHIWPRHEFMLIALPNLDKSFTVTLFMPFRNYEKILTGDDVIEFFKDHFDDAIPLIGEDLLRTSFFTMPALPMVSVRCNPFHCGNTTVLLGDAAHAIIPFYGQGLNGGLEDALIFDELMEEFRCDFSQVLPAFSEVRVHAGHAIADLSVYNYMEMRSHVATPWFLLRKKVDGLLNFFLPSKFIPRYTMVAFTRIPYDEIVKKADRQDKIVDTSLMILGGVLIVLGVWGVRKVVLNWSNFKLLSFETLVNKFKA